MPRARRDRGLRARIAGRLLQGAGQRRWATGDVAFRARRLAFERLARRLAASSEPERRSLAAMLRGAVEARDGAAAAAIASTAARTPDLRAEKVVSRRYRFVWLCNPKAASRSLIAGLRAADPDAELVRHATLAEIQAARPEVADYTSVAFVRHPVGRCYSFWRDKHALAMRRRDARRWFIEPWHGLATGMTFAELCRWLVTPCGSDVFADRHWLSQHRQIRTADGRLADFVGAFERLDEDWRALCGRLGLAHRALPRLNAGPPGGGAAVEGLDAETRELLARRYAEDFRLAGYGSG